MLTHPGTKGTAITVDARNPQIKATARVTIVPADFISSHAWNKSKEIRIKDTVCARHAWDGIYHYYRREWCLGRFALHRLQEPGPAMLLLNWRSHNNYDKNIDCFNEPFRAIISKNYYNHSFGFLRTTELFHVIILNNYCNYCYFGFPSIKSKCRPISVFSAIIITEVIIFRFNLLLLLVNYCY